jgi:hypothetical protein
LYSDHTIAIAVERPMTSTSTTTTVKASTNSVELAYVAVEPSTTPTVDDEGHTEVIRDPKRSLVMPHDQGLTQLLCQEYSPSCRH